jgi:hypothetical protein
LRASGRAHMTWTFPSNKANFMTHLGSAGDETSGVAELPIVKAARRN